MLPFSSKPVRSSSDFENEMSLGTILIQSFIKTKSKSHLWPLNSAAQELKVVCPSHVPTHVFHSKLTPQYILFSDYNPVHLQFILSSAYCMRLL